MSFALLSIQLIIPPMIPGNASAVLIPNWPNRDAKALSLFLIYSFKPFSSLGGGSPPPPDTAATPPLPGNRDLKQHDAFNRTWWSVLSIDKLITWQPLSIERTGVHVVLKASSCLRCQIMLRQVPRWPSQ